VSLAAKDLLQKLLCPVDKRLGKNGLDDFKNHRFFTSINWDNLRQSNKSVKIIKPMMFCFYSGSAAQT
jgi:hypothetical protein